MTTAELGQRMGLTQSRVSQIERSEELGSIRLDTLERAAQALNCQVRYVFVPNEPLEQMVQRQARLRAQAEVDAVTHTMALEDQVPEPGVLDSLVTGDGRAIRRRAPLVGAAQCPGSSMTAPGDPLLPLGDGHTPLDGDDREGLKLTYITTRSELNEAEQENILRARHGRRHPTLQALLDDKYLRDLHRAMFGDVWAWAGSYRRLETSIGIDPARIAVGVRDLVADTKIWAEHEEPLCVAVRFHHRLVSIHPFPNGNGRHGRQAADYLMEALKQPPFTWGAVGGRGDVEGTRRRYLAALREADNGDLAPLEQFVVS
jgi:Fic-DOC domain mobile mystery protein B